MRYGVVPDYYLQCLQLKLKSISMYKPLRNRSILPLQHPDTIHKLSWVQLHASLVVTKSHSIQSNENLIDNSWAKSQEDGGVPWYGMRWNERKNCRFTSIYWSGKDWLILAMELRARFQGALQTMHFFYVPGSQLPLDTANSMFCLAGCNFL